MFDLIISVLQIVGAILAALGVYSAENDKILRIDNGNQAAVDGQFPFHVLIVSSGTCSAIVLNKNYVLTAAQCVQDSNPKLYNLYFGVLNLKDIDKSIYRSVSEVTIHEDFDKPPYHNDIALLRLNKPLEFSDIIKPVTLPKSGEDFTNKIVTVFGWVKIGSAWNNKALHYASHRIIDDGTCKKKYKGLICSTSYDHKSQNVCSGEYGGPVILNGTDKLVGIVNVRTSECNRNSYSLRVSDYIGWIDKNTK